MSTDPQEYLDAAANQLSNINVYLRRYTDDVAEFVDSRVDQAANFVRDSISNSSWIPTSIKPSTPPIPPVAVIPLSRLERMQDWLNRNKILTGVVVLACGTVIYRGYKANCSAKKVRRARRARNGGRSDVVVIAGSPTLPLTKSLALDMERRGFIVYIVCNAAEDQAMVSALARPDIRPLSIDITNPPKAGASIEYLAQQLQSPKAPGPNIKPNQLTLKSVILIPSLHYQTSPIATIPPSNFANLFNTHLLQPILTIQAFLPLLTSRLQPIGEKWIAPKVLVFTPSIISSINPPFHAPEATVCSALSAFTEVLAAELRPLDISVTHMQLGTFDFSGFLPARQTMPLTAGNPEDTLVWPDEARHVYGRNFVAQTTSAISGGRVRGFKGSSLRHLHNAVFDVMDGSITSSSVRVGLGAGMYGFVGQFVPRGLVAWMMGIRRVDQLSTWKTSSYEGSSGDESDDGDENASASQEFVAVHSEANIWHAEQDNAWVPTPKTP